MTETIVKCDQCGERANSQYLRMRDTDAPVDYQWSDLCGLPCLLTMVQTRVDKVMACNGVANLQIIFAENK